MNFHQHGEKMKLFCDCASYNGIKEAAQDKTISGFTTNPTLMKQAGITDYEWFARETIRLLSENRPDTCLSLEVFEESIGEVVRQAKLISSWGDQYNYPVYVKIPVIDSQGNSMIDIIEDVSLSYHIKVNVTAVFTVEQIIDSLSSLSYGAPSIISIFAGRMSDAGYDASHYFKRARIERSNIEGTNNIEFLWASSREAYNYKDAEYAGADIITMTPELIKKVKGFGKSLKQFSIETSKMFYDDAKASGFKI